MTEPQLTLFLLGAASVLRRDLMRMAGEVHLSTVRCRLQPRKGAVRAPFPPTNQPE